MKKYIILFVATILFIACSKDENDTPYISDEDLIIYQNSFDNAAKYMEENPDISLDDAAIFLQSLDGVTKVIEEDSLIQVTTQGDVTFTFDFNTYPDFENENIDINYLQNRLDSIDKAIGANFSDGYENTSDVFNHYLASIDHNEASSDVSTVMSRGASSVQKVKLKRYTVAVWNPWKEFSGETACVYDVTHFINKKKPLQEFKKFTPSSFNSFSDFDLIYLSSHGNIKGQILLPLDLPAEQLKQYNKEYGLIELYYEMNRGEKQYKAIALTDKFYKKYLPDLSNTIIFASACFLGVKNSDFLKACLNKNVADYFASDDYCTCKHIVKNFQNFYINLICGYSTNMSFTNGRGYFIGSYVYKNLPWTYRFSRYGSKLVYYPTPHATGVGNKNDNTNTRSDNSDSSAIIVNAQLRYATEESDDILKSIEAGICLQDMDTKEVKLIPFSNNNMVSNEKKTYGDITVSNIAISLNELEEGKQYVYCCYTKVNGQITLSDECYPISDNYYLKIYYKRHFISDHEYWKTTYKDGRVPYERDIKLTPSEDYESSLRIAKINGKYYIFEEGLPQRLYADNSLIEYPYSFGESSYDGHGKAQCMMDNNTIHLKWSYTWKEPLYYDLDMGDGGYSKGYRVNSFEDEVEIKNLNSDLTASWPDVSWINEDYTTEASWWAEWNIAQEYCKSVLVSNKTFLFFEKSDIPSEDLLNWEKRKKYWCELVNGTKKQAN